MQIIELNLRNFKKFTEHNVRFAPGVNLIWGPNESGKSTIHEAIVCALFDRGKNKAVESWHGGTCFVRLVYEVNNKTYAIERQLSKGSCRIGLLKGRELTEVIEEKPAVQEIISDHLGISEKTVFESTVSVQQSAVKMLDESAPVAVGQEIQRILTGAGEGSVASALERLQKEQQEIKGRTRPKKPREYDQIEARLQELAQALADARKSHQRIHQIKEEISILEDKVARDSERLAALDGLVSRYERWAELKRKQAELEKSHASVFNTLRQIEKYADDLRTTQAEIEKAPELVGKADELHEHLTQLASRRSELETRLRSLEEASTGYPQRATTLSQLLWIFLGLALTGAAIWLGVNVRREFFALLALTIIGCGIAYRRLRTAAGKSQHEGLTRLTEQAQEELNQLQLEEQSILSYVKCQTIEQALSKIKQFQSLLARVHEIEIALNTLLAGRKTTDLENDEASLARELSVINHELDQEFPDYAPTTEESEGWRSEHASLTKSITEAQSRLHALRGELEAETRNARDLANLEGELQFLHRRKSELEFLHKAYDEAISAMKTVIAKVCEEYLPTLSEKATATLSRITNGRYSSLRMDSEWNINLDCTEKTNIEPTVLSGGTADQVYFALRIACGDLLSAGRALPIILDDPFVNFDRERLERVLEIIRTLADRNQIILFTHDQYVLEWAHRINANVHMLTV